MTNVYTVQGMDCAHCAREVEEGVARLPGVRTVEVDFATARMRLEGDVPFDVLQTRVSALGKTLLPADAAPKPVRGGAAGFWDHLSTRPDTRLALGGGAAALVVALLTLVLSLPENLSAAAYTACMLVMLYPIARSGINTLRLSHQFSINLLMSIAALGAIVIGETLESAVVVFVFAIGEAMEGYTSERARRSIQSLVALKPSQALRLRAAESGLGLPLLREEEVPVAALALNDVVLVKPGEQIPVDGTVESGASSVNQAPITGESVPAAKSAGESVFAGTINGEGTLTVRVTRLAADNTLSRIIQMVEEAQGMRAPSQRVIDRFAQVYTPAVTLAALAVALVPPLVFGAPFYDTAAAHGWLYRALTMLVIACPCALVISTPVTIISAITAAARAGVLIKGGAHLEALGTVRAVAFDKTGTLTAGKPEVVAWRATDCESGEMCARCDDVLALAAAVERRTAHPLAEAVVNAAETRHVGDQYHPAEQVEMMAGRGVRGIVDGKQVMVGSHRLFDDEIPHAAALCAEMNAVEAQGNTTVLIAGDGQMRGYIALADTPRADSRSVIAALNALNIETVMLTGDQAGAAQRVGMAVGVRDVRANLLPDAKAQAVRELIARYGSVAMVGDGVNDTPSLAAATVGIAMGGAGSPQALETADVALMADDLRQLPYALKLARFARALIRQNIALSIGLKLAFLLLAVGGLASLWVAILADVGMMVAVSLNGMRPLRMRS